MANLKDIRGRIASVKNIRKITRAMEMVAAARLRRAEQRIEALRPYADALRRMTRRASEAAGNIPNMPILQEREDPKVVGILLVTGDRGLAGPFNSQIMRAGNRRAATLRGRGQARCSGTPPGAAASPRCASAGSRRAPPGPGSPTARPSPTRARSPTAWPPAYVDGKVDRVEIIYNGFISAVTQEVRVETLLPLQQADILGGDDDGGRRGRGGAAARAEHSRALWDYEPDPEEILARLVPDYVEISIFRALLESTASEHGARMSAMRNASDNAAELIDDLTLAANRQRQAEITQEIMEVVAGAEGVT